MKEALSATYGDKIEHGHLTAAKTLGVHAPSHCRRDISRRTGTVFHNAPFPESAFRAFRRRQVEAAGVLGVTPPKASALANYRLDGFSVEKLMEFLTLLNQDVENLIRPARESVAPGHVSVQAVR